MRKPGDPGSWHPNSAGIRGIETGIRGTSLGMPNTEGNATDAHALACIGGDANRPTRTFEFFCEAIIANVPIVSDNHQQRSSDANRHPLRAVKTASPTLLGGMTMVSVCCRYWERTTVVQMDGESVAAKLPAQPQIVTET